MKEIISLLKTNIMWNFKTDAFDLVQIIWLCEIPIKIVRLV